MNKEARKHGEVMGEMCRNLMDERDRLMAAHKALHQKMDRYKKALEEVVLHYCADDGTEKGRAYYMIALEALHPENVDSSEVEG